MQNRQTFWGILNILKKTREKNIGDATNEYDSENSKEKLKDISNTDNKLMDKCWAIAYSD